MNIKISKTIYDSLYTIIDYLEASLDSSIVDDEEIKIRCDLIKSVISIPVKELEMFLSSIKKGLDQSKEVTIEYLDNEDDNTQLDEYYANIIYEINKYNKEFDIIFKYSNEDEDEDEDEDSNNISIDGSSSEKDINEYLDNILKNKKDERR